MGGEGVLLLYLFDEAVEGIESLLADIRASIVRVMRLVDLRLFILGFLAPLSAKPGRHQLVLSIHDIGHEKIDHGTLKKVAENCQVSGLYGLNNHRKYHEGHKNCVEDHRWLVGGELCHLSEHFGPLNTDEGVEYCRCIE